MQLFLSISALLDDEDLLDSTGYRTKTILSSKYEEVDVDDIAAQQKHLSQRQQQDLAAVLKQHTKLFSGKLGLYTGRQVHLKLEPGTKPISSRPYGVPKMHQALFKEELDRLEKEGVLSQTGASEWLSPTFIVPKKDRRVQWVLDFHALNKVIKHKVYNLSRIQDILSRCTGYQYFSKIDISMQYYMFELDESSKELCTICTPFGYYQYNQLRITLLYGCNMINIHTDHKNNIFTKQSNQCVLRWRLFLEDYGINFQYIKGCHNHLADSLSRLPFNERQKDTSMAI
jgi:hypothetical protein